MKRFIAIMFLTTGLGLVSTGILRAEDQYPAGNYNPPVQPAPPANEAADSRFQELSAKLNSMDAKQDQILRQLEEIKQQLEVVKVRASLKG